MGGSPDGYAGAIEALEGRPDRRLRRKFLNHEQALGPDSLKPHARPAQGKLHMEETSPGCSPDHEFFDRIIPVQHAQWPVDVKVVRRRKQDPLTSETGKVAHIVVH